jgi:ABC-type branched-subunit amino acid transport system substrate-binding protein
MASEDTKIGSVQKQGYEVALQEINKNNEAGGCPIELVYKNEGDSGDAETSQVALLSLADEGVVAIVGASSNDATIKAAAISQNLKIPLIIPFVSGDDLTKKENQWVYRISASNRVEADTAFSLVKSQLGSKANIAILFEETAFGENAAVQSAESVMENNMQIVMYQRFDTASRDFDALFTQAVKDQADAIYLICNDTGVAQTLINSAVKQSADSLQIFGSGNGFTDVGFLYDSAGGLNKTLGNTMIVTPWAKDLPWKGIDTFTSNLDAYGKKINSGGPYIAVTRNVESYTALHFVTNAITATLADEKSDWRTKLTKSENLPGFREALSLAMRNKGILSESLLGTIAFDTFGQNNQQPVIIQSIDGQLNTVYPAQVAKKTPVFTQGW